MTFLPIVTRELRVAVRKRSTFWVRTISGLVGLTIAAACLLLSMAQGLGTVRMGDVLFKVLSWLALGGVLSAGLFFTSDSLSEEKREGTLGLLFLTDLRGYDVVFGKLLATSLRAFYALLALFPILAVTLLMGGVTGAQFFKACLALVNALIFSLAVGMWISSMSKDAQKAMGATLFLLLLLVIAAPLCDTAISTGKRQFGPWFSLLSPGYTFVSADAWGGSAFWKSFVVSHTLAWLLLAVASVLVPRTWQQKAGGGTVIKQHWLYVWKYGGAQRRLNLRRRLLARDPILWLACRERWQAIGVWIMALLALGGVIGFMQLSDLWVGWNYLNGILTLVLYFAVATQASRFFVDARKTGLIELLLAAPLNNGQIVHGQVRGLLRMFGLPITLILITQLAAGLLSASALTNRAGPGASWMLISVLTAAVGVVTIAANLIALCCFGMWMGMTSRNVNTATLKTIAFVQIIPWLVITFGSSMVAMLILIPRLISQGRGSSQIMVWFPLISACVGGSLAVAKDVGFILWARKRLHRSLREQASQGTMSVQHGVHATPMLPPPVIAAGS